MTLRYAIIGAGNIGKHHARVVSELGEAELVAVVDANTKTAEEFSKMYGTRIFTDAATMIEACRPDAVSVCVPTSRHVEVGLECIRRGVHVLIEKPIAATLEGGKQLIEAAAQHAVQLMVGHIERFNPAVIKVKELLDEGKIGKVVSIMARRVGVFPPQIKDANIAIDLAIHDIDIVSYLLGEAPSRITAAKRRNHLEQREDSVEIFLSYPSASAYIQANWITPVKIRKLNITGTDGYLEMDYINQHIQCYRSNYEKYREEPGHIDGFADHVLKYMEPDILDIRVPKREPLKEEIRYFLQAIESKKPLDASHAIEALAVALQC